MNLGITVARVAVNVAALMHDYLRPWQIALKLENYWRNVEYTYLMTPGLSVLNMTLAAMNSFGLILRIFRKMGLCDFEWVS